MGKKTDKYMLAVSQGLNGLRTLRKRLAELAATVKEYSIGRDRASKIMNDYYKKKGWAGQKVGREEAMEADAAYQKLIKAWEAEFAKVDKVANEMENKKGEIAKAKIPLRKLIQEFSDFVENKAKTKTFPWQKTSVEPARAFIKNAKAIVG